MKKILIVDDVKGWRDFNSDAMKEIFGAENTEIHTAESARQAYDELIMNNSEPFDIILTDLQMEDDFFPKEAGEWFVEQIKSFNRYNNTKVIIVSASYKIKHTASVLNIGCVPKSNALNCIMAFRELLDEV